MLIIEKTDYLSVHRYTTSAFLRLKLGKEPGERSLSTRMHETVDAAEAVQGGD